MTKQEFNEYLFEYLKENLDISVNVGDYQSYDGELCYRADVQVKLKNPENDKWETVFLSWGK